MDWIIKVMVDVAKFRLVHDYIPQLHWHECIRTKAFVAVHLSSLQVTVCLLLSPPLALALMRNHCNYCRITMILLLFFLTILSDVCTHGVALISIKGCCADFP